MGDAGFHSGMVITILACILAVILNALAVIILVILCRRRRRKRVRKTEGLETEPVYSVAEDIGGTSLGNRQDYQDDQGYEIPVPPPYTYNTPFGNTRMDSPSDSTAILRGDVGTYLLAITPERQERNFNEDNSREQNHQNNGMNNSGVLKPSVELTIALYRPPNS